MPWVSNQDDGKEEDQTALHSNPSLTPVPPVPKDRPQAQGHKTPSCFWAPLCSQIAHRPIISPVHPPPRERKRDRQRDGTRSSTQQPQPQQKREAASDAAGAHNHDSTTPAASLYRRHPASRRLVASGGCHQFCSVIAARSQCNATPRYLGRQVAIGDLRGLRREHYILRTNTFLFDNDSTTHSPRLDQRLDTIPVLEAPRLPALSANPPGLPSDDGPHRRPSAPAIQASLP